MTGAESALVMCESEAGTVQECVSDMKKMRHSSRMQAKGGQC